MPERLATKAQQERLFPISEIDKRIASGQIAIIGIARKLLEEHQEAVLAQYNEVNSVYHFLSARFGEISRIKKSFEERAEALDSLEKFAHMVGDEDGLSAPYFMTLRNAIGDPQLLEEAEMLRGDNTTV